MKAAKKSINASKHQLAILLSVSAVLFAVELINLLTNRSLGALGIYPRAVDSLPMIFTSPFIHGNPGHLIANWSTLMIFMVLMRLQGGWRFFAISLWIIVTSGLAVWLFARTAIHLGASGVIYGYFGFLVLAGWRSKRKRMLFVSLAVAFIYGTMVFGVMPTSDYVSWESHLFGFIAGITAAWFWAK